MQKKFRLIIGVLLCCLFFRQAFAQSDGKKFYYDEKDKYSLSYPSDWEILNTDTYVRLLPVRKDSEVIIEPLFQIATTAWSDNLDSFVKSNFNREILTGRYRNFKLIDEKEEKINSMPAHMIEFSYELTGEAVQTICYMIEKNNRVYLLMGIGPQQHFENQLKQKYVDIAHSLRIISFIMPE